MINPTAGVEDLAATPHHAPLDLAIACQGKSQGART
jgi:hypothetical protein